MTFNIVGEDDLQRRALLSTRLDRLQKLVLLVFRRELHRHFNIVKQVHLDLERARMEREDPRGQLLRTK